MKSNKIFALIDINSFFCSCERIFNPKLKNVPLVVLSNNDGCVVARTKEAKDLGVEMCAPFFKIKHLVKTENLHAYSSNYTLYADISSRIMKLISSISPNIEIYSIDEAFIELTGVQEDLHKFGMMIKNKIKQDIGVPSCVGIARTKVLAKLANNIAKKSIKSNGVVELTNSRYLDIALERTKVEDIWGIGKKSAQKLRSLGIKNALKFRDYNNDKLIQKTLTKVGRQIQDELREISCMSLDNSIDKKKQIICSRTFGSYITSITELKQACSKYVSKATSLLRKQKSLATLVTVYITTNTHKKDSIQYFNQRSHHFLSPTSDTVKMIRAVESMIDVIYKDDIFYNKAGIILSQFVDEDYVQLNFFNKNDSKRENKLMRSMDNINEIYGDYTLYSSACGIQQQWEMKRELKSDHYTTDVNELLKIK